jgi:rare lipoprotein A
LKFGDGALQIFFAMRRFSFPLPRKAVIINAIRDLSFFSQKSDPLTMNSRKMTFALTLGLLLSGVFMAFKPNAAEFGKATYYANSFQGKKTASGQPYDRGQLTCAHKSYPFGTLLRVTRLDTQNSVEVRVNDRGPYAEGYVIDLSYSAAEAIDMIKNGVVKVKVEVVEAAPAKASKTPAATTPKAASTPAVAPETRSTDTATRKTVEAAAGKTPKGVTAPKTEEKPTVAPKTEAYQIDVKKMAATGFGVQLLTVSDADNAIREASKLQAKWKNRIMLVAATDEYDVTTYKIVLGPFKTRKEAEAQQKVATKQGHSKCFVVDLAK